ncbi:MAG TPA: VTT domain-containing protein [Candidatus Paceibacterota bacterium]|nr:VTT domain-containing protein [Candidatus Paceibacterota bacterium]
MFLFLSHLIGNEAGRMFVLPFTILVCAIFLEDVTTVIVGLLAADGFISVPVAFLALYAGATLGDISLYFMGRLARSYSKLGEFIEHDVTASVKKWLDRRYRFTVFSGHFVPGLRFTTFVASGFFHYPFRRYFPAALAGGFVLVSVLLTLSYLFGSLTTKWVGPGRWIIAIVFLVVLVLIGRHNLMAYRESKADEE